MARLTQAERHAQQQSLIAGIASGMSVIEAAAQAGIGWRRAYVWRAEDAAFRAAWDQARAQIQGPALQRALTVPPSAAGTSVPALVVPPSPPLPPRQAKKAGPPNITVVVRRLGTEPSESSDPKPPGP